jgi:hypothetical protein
VFKDGKANSGCPLNKGMVRIEVEQIAIATSGRDAEDVLERLLVVGSSRQRFNLHSASL